MEQIQRVPLGLPCSDGSHPTHQGPSVRIIYLGPGQIQAGWAIEPVNFNWIPFITWVLYVPALRRGGVDVSGPLRKS